MYITHLGWGTTVCRDSHEAHDVFAGLRLACPTLTTHHNALAALSIFR